MKTAELENASTPALQPLSVTVRRLVEHFYMRGDLAAGFADPYAAVQGISAHKEVQLSRSGDYEREVAVSHTVLQDGFELTVTGRIDGIQKDAQGVLIEEIKSTAADLDILCKDPKPHHWAQARCYGFIYAAAHGLSRITLQITYFQRQSKAVREIRQKVEFAELADFFEALTRQYLARAAGRRAWRHIRDDSINRLAFPFGTYRKGQRQMAVEVYRCICQKGQLITQAPTGIGKTAAALFPALKAQAEGQGEKIFYLTARTTGRAAAETALDQMRACGLRVKSITLTAKEKVCLKPGAACDAEECQFARAYFDRINGVLADIGCVEGFTRQEVIRIATDYQICPFELSLDLALAADVVICDYNYAFDPRVLLRRFFVDRKGDYVFLIDEAHNLVDRGRDMFSAHLQKQTFLAVRRRLKEHLPGVYRSLSKINVWFLAQRKRLQELDGIEAIKAAPEDLLPLLERFCRQAEAWLQKNRPAPFGPELTELYYAVTGFLKIAQGFDDTYVTLYALNQGDLDLKLLCLDPSRHLEKGLKRARAAVFFSATMIPMPYFKALMGCDDDVGQLLLPSPFPEENCCLMLADRISTLYKRRQTTAPDVARMIKAMVEAQVGNYLIFLPSYVYLEMVCDIFADMCPEVHTIRQTREMSEDEREAFLKTFDAENSRTLVGFAVMGGIFGEGIDLKGERLTGAAICGVGLPGISPERDLIRDYFQKTRNQGFQYAYLCPGMNRVLQAAGRVIRSSRDRGVILLIDERFATHRYASLLPPGWQPRRVPSEQEIRADLDTFWHPQKD